MKIGKALRLDVNGLRDLNPRQGDDLKDFLVLLAKTGRMTPLDPNLIQGVTFERTLEGFEVSVLVAVPDPPRAKEFLTAEIYSWHTDIQLPIWVAARLLAKPETV